MSRHSGSIVLGKCLVDQFVHVCPSPSSDSTDIQFLFSQIMPRLEFDASRDGLSPTLVGKELQSFAASTAIDRLRNCLLVFWATKFKFSLNTTVENLDLQLGCTDCSKLIQRRPNSPMVSQK